jgi:hypothetical protein
VREEEAALNEVNGDGILEIWGSAILKFSDI